MDATAILPELTGTEKQVAWALDIRTKIVARLATARAELERQIPLALERGKATEAQCNAMRAAADAYVAGVEAHAEAGWWIENRDGRFVDSMQGRARKAM